MLQHLRAHDILVHFFRPRERRTIEFTEHNNEDNAGKRKGNDAGGPSKLIAADISVRGFFKRERREQDCKNLSPWQVAPDLTLHQSFFLLVFVANLIVI